MEPTKRALHGVKVCHIVENLNESAVENWLIRSLRQAEDAGYQCDWSLYCVVGGEGRLDAEARRLGAEVYHARKPLSQKVAFLRELRAFLRSRKVDVVHSHHDVLSGFYFLATLGLPIRRFIYVHNASQTVPVGANWKRKALLPLLRQLSLTLSHKIVAISQHTLAKFVGRPLEGRDSVVYLGIDTGAYTAAEPVFDLRSEIGVAPNAKIVLMVGRLVPEKNPVFLVEMLPYLVAERQDVVACVVGNGPMAEGLRARAEELGVTHHLRILGFRNNVPALMQQADLFVFVGHDDLPEGLGLVVVEAQAAGLRSLVSHAIPEDAIVIPKLVTRVAVADGPRAWANAASNLLRLPVDDRRAALRAVESSPFEARRALSNLMAMYAR